MSSEKYVEMTRGTEKSRVEISGVKRRWLSLLITLAAVSSTVLAVAPGAHADHYTSISGKIVCQSYPNVTVGASATAKGQVHFKLWNYDMSGIFWSVNVGSSSVYAPWSTTFYTQKAGTLNVIAYGSAKNGWVQNSSRYCKAAW